MEEGFRIRMVFVWASGRKGRALAGEMGSDSSGRVGGKAGLGSGTTQ